ncbi:hypothetical protein BJ508DRAFT_314324 [Ascobolus immersus RN42]|uniref:Uncharacterized protein n=1 Tax=Ascobolus immersus RN42 TaxID=1160509 RepID=A0A3N4HTB3_ASCIM|nr:hypothetical protein BJ508DRAFT_314324 [Ascobolus immersus RN42]
MQYEKHHTIDMQYIPTHWHNTSTVPHASTKLHGKCHNIHTAPRIHQKYEPSNLEIATRTKYLHTRISYRLQNTKVLIAYESEDARIKARVNAPPSRGSLQDSSDVHEPILTLARNSETIQLTVPNNHGEDQKGMSRTADRMSELNERLRHR